MATDKPLISILMAVYEPRMDWLREQLCSLNAQTYSNLRLYIRDDCSPTVSYAEIQSCVQECISAFPWSIGRNESNLGSNGTFELLTKEADGEYFAYSDQDDIWLPEKLTVLQSTIERENALLVCSDMYIMNGDGKKIANSITKVRRHHKFKSGTDLSEGLLLTNFVTGCTMLIDAQTAKKAVPFCPYMVHDHYLTLFTSIRGKIISLSERLIQYRLHGNNQTGIMAGVYDQESYGDIRIDVPIKKLEWLETNLACEDSLRKVIHEQKNWMQARHDNWNYKKRIKDVWSGRAYSPLSALFEVIAPRAPAWLFRMAIYLNKKNII